MSTLAYTTFQHQQTILFWRREQFLCNYFKRISIVYIEPEGFTRIFTACYNATRIIARIIHLHQPAFSSIIT